MQTLLEQLLQMIRDAVAQSQQDQTSSCQAPITEQSVREVCSNARFSLEGYMSNESWLSVENNLCLAVSDLEEYRRRCCDWDEFDLLARLSRVRVCVGLSQALLLCPSPVDPIVVSRTKYQCLQQLVRHGQLTLPKLDM